MMRGNEDTGLSWFGISFIQGFAKVKAKVMEGKGL